MKSLFDSLYDYCNTDAYPLHMPGHKRNRELLNKIYRGSNWNPFEIDITEIDGFDNLHHAEGILLHAQKRASQLYDAKESFFLINGSTCGILAAVFASVEQRGTILIARNCHKAVYHAAMLRELETEYVYPTICEDYQINGEIIPEDVEKELMRNNSIEAVLITSPSYDGIVSDVEKIAEIVHRYGKLLIVDEAHGAHLGFHEYFPKGALQAGADIVIHSLHKTLPSMTQTALLQIGKNSGADIRKIRKYLGIFETSSPSYVMMAGMDQCICYLQEHQEKLFQDFSGRLKQFYKETEMLCHIHIVNRKNQDHSKIVIFADSLNGQELADILRKNYHLEVEMEAKEYVLALMSICDTDQGFKRLFQALQEIDEMIGKKEKRNRETVRISLEREKYCSISEADKKKKTTCDIEKSLGKICGEFLYLYPPGIPLIVPGEIISSELIREMISVTEEGFELQGMQDYSCRTIQIIDMDE